jgi:hypothetical protein
MCTTYFNITKICNLSVVSNYVLSVETVIISLNIIKILLFGTESQYVCTEVGPKFKNIIWMNLRIQRVNMLQLYHSRVSTTALNQRYFPPKTA